MDMQHNIHFCNCLDASNGPTPPPHLPRNNVVKSKQFSGQGAQNTTLLGGEEGRETVSVVLC